jgi:hypothetical protein
MSKYLEVLNDVESLFGQASWSSNNISAYPSNFPKSSENTNVKEEFIVIEVIPGRPFTNYGTTGLKGQIIIQIYTEVDKGVKRAYEIADILDTILERKELTSGPITGTSSMSNEGVDQDDEHLFRTDYNVSFTKY